MGIERFRRSRKPVATDTESWFGGRMVFTVHTYLGLVSEPIEPVTSVRCVLRCRNRIMLMKDAEGRQHVLPGGRIEPGESHLGALSRELLEETGYTLAKVEQLGACVFTHTTPRPTDDCYPYPRFVHLIYRGEAGEHNPRAWKRHGHEVSSRFVKREELDSITLTDGERVFVDAGPP
ncbi:MAG: NUDIX hydrolase [Gammaproteobacteria bacterium]|nr:NUDIX hydrolase [Gammaproteobacteria bacterium]